MAVILMTFESLMVHSMGPKRVSSSTTGSKKVNDGSGPFINKYNRMESAAEEDKKEREGDVMGL